MRAFVAVIGLVALFAVVFGVNLLKSNVRALEAELRGINAQIDEARWAIHTLEADLAHLRRPQRLAKQADKVSMRPASAAGVVRIDGVPSAERLALMQVRFRVPLAAGGEAELRARPLPQLEDKLWSGQ